MNVFEGLNMDGGLYGFSPWYRYMDIVSNKQAPGLIEAMEGRTAISLNEMFELYERFKPIYGLNFMWQFNPRWALTRWNLHEFVDHDARVAHFNSQNFIDFLTLTNDVTTPGTGFAIPFARMGDRNLLFEASQNYFFRAIHYIPIEFMGIFYEDPYFSNPVFLVDDGGRVITDPVTFDAWKLNAQATPTERALAMDFFMFAAATDMRMPIRSMSPFYYGIYSFGGTQTHPVKRTARLYGLEAYLNLVYGWFYDDWILNTGRREAFEVIKDYMMQIDNMPTIRPAGTYRAIYNHLVDLIEQFHNGILSAEQVAQEMQNRAVLILLEMG